LPSVHDLEVRETSHDRAAVAFLDLDRFCSGGDPVVVGEEHRWFFFDGLSDPFVHITSRLEENSDILFQEARLPSIIDRGEDAPWKSGEISLVG